MKVILVAMRQQNKLTVLQDIRVDWLGEDMPLTTVSGAHEPRVGHDLRVARVNKQTSVTDIFDFHLNIFTTLVENLDRQDCRCLPECDSRLKIQIPVHFEDLHTRRCGCNRPSLGQSDGSGVDGPS